MKKAYEILQAYALAIIILLAAFRQVLNLAASVNTTLAGTVLIVLTIVSLVVFLMCLWYFRSDWKLPHRGYMLSLLWAGVHGLMIGVSGLHYALTGVTEFHILMINFSWMPYIPLLLGIFVEIAERPSKKKA